MTESINKPICISFPRPMSTTTTKYPKPMIPDIRSGIVYHPSTNFSTRSFWYIWLSSNIASPKKLMLGLVSHILPKLARGNTAVRKKRYSSSQVLAINAVEHRVIANQGKFLWNEDLTYQNMNANIPFYLSFFFPPWSIFFPYYTIFIFGSIFFLFPLPQFIKE